MIITDQLAARLETAEALDAAGCAEAACRSVPECDAIVKAAAGGILIFCGETSPLTHAIAVAMHGPVAGSDIDEIEDFFRSRGAPVVIDVCPHAHPSLREILVERGYRISEMNNVLVRGLNSADQFPTVQGIDVVTADEAELYSQTVMAAFFSRQHVTADEFALGLTLFYMPCASPILALADGQPAGGCGLSMRNGVACLYGDATLLPFRRRGIHAALIAERLRRAAHARCELATASAVPGSASQRNYGRFGFEVAYTKLTMFLD